MLNAGAAVIDITPGPGLRMIGYVARTGRATGAHDPLTVRALVYGNCAIVVACVEQACVDAIAMALKQARPCRLRAGIGVAPGIAHNSLPVVSIVDEFDNTIATLVSYACHPVVLGADNLEYTADYPHYVRLKLERDAPGSIAIFVTGAAADANTGHSASDSITLAANEQRSFQEAQRIGEHIAHCAQQAHLTDVGTDTQIENRQVTLLSRRNEKFDPAALCKLWSEALQQAEGAQIELLECWINWAKTIATQSAQPLRVRVTVMTWGSIQFVALPGEIFASTAFAVRKLQEQFSCGVVTPSIVAAPGPSLSMVAMRLTKRTATMAGQPRLIQMLLAGYCML